MSRPQHSQEPMFQLTAAGVHLFCAVFNVGAVIYHLRRIQGERNVRHAS